MVTVRPDVAPHPAVRDLGPRPTPAPADHGTASSTTPDPELVKAERLAEYDRESGPARYYGGPVDWNSGQPAMPSAGDL